MLTRSSRLSQERGALDIAHNRAKMHTTGQKHTTGRSAHNRANANKRYLHKPNKPFCSYSWLIRWYVKHYGDSRTRQTVHLNPIWAVVQIFAFKANVYKYLCPRRPCSLKWWHTAGHKCPVVCCTMLGCVHVGSVVWRVTGESCTKPSIFFHITGCHTCKQ